MPRCVFQLLYLANLKHHLKIEYSNTTLIKNYGVICLWGMMSVQPSLIHHQIQSFRFVLMWLQTSHLQSQMTCSLIMITKCSNIEHVVLARINLMVFAMRARTKDFHLFQTIVSQLDTANPQKARIQSWTRMLKVPHLLDSAIVN